MGSCRLCPRMCGADREKGEKGYCGQGTHMRIARASLHAWEEPCISGTGGSGTVFFCGCPLGCVICQNAAISGRKAPGREVTPGELAEVCLYLQEAGAHNINLVTAVHFVPEVVRSLAIAVRRGLTIPIVYNTSGYENVETLRMLDGLVDIYLADCKYFSPVLSQRISRAPEYFTVCMEAVAEMIRQTGDPVFAGGLDAAAYNASLEDLTEEADYAGALMERGTIVRHLMLPGQLSDSLRVVDELLSRFGDHFYLSLMNQYTPMPLIADQPDLNRRVSEEEYEKLVDHAIAAGLKNGFFQGEGTAEESFIPPFDGTIPGI